MIDELELKILNALGHFKDGWSISAAMKKAGFVSNWYEKKEIRDHPKVLLMRELNIERNNDKRKFKVF